MAFKYWDEVQENRVRLLPILVEDCEIPKLLQDKKYADFRYNYSLGLITLVNAIQIFGSYTARDSRPEPSRVMSFSAVLHETLEDLEERLGVMLLGLPTGFLDFDRMTSGLRRGYLYLLTGPPRVGKTAFGLNVAQHVAFRERMRVALFSPEVSSKDCAIRILCSETDVPLRNLRHSQMSTKDWNRIITATRNIADSPLFIEDSASPSPEAIAARAREIGQEKRVDLIIIDDLQSVQIHPTGGKDKLHIRQAANCLRRAAEEVGAAVLLLLSSTWLDEEGPVLDGDSEAQHWVMQADFAALLRRRPKEPADITVLRNRVGDTGALKLVFLEESVSFRELGKKVESELGQAALAFNDEAGEKVPK